MDLAMVERSIAKYGAASYKPQIWTCEYLTRRLDGDTEAWRGSALAAEVERVVAVVLWCAHPDPRARPSIRAAMAALQSNGPLPAALPAKMPVPTYTVPVASASSSGTMSSSLTLQTTMTTTTHTSCSSDTSSTSAGLKDSSSLLKHQY
uniref:Serine-threonine/tyrosine-protein kinase catalytic domain-containing protein n=1 Tax=Setaria viridis TaxID=4556 RepID=A0A4U6TNJ0_SETVI|nr:hypothetical protein SEVIR_8G224400v2 [Setaria viridis]